MNLFIYSINALTTYKEIFLISKGSAYLTTIIEIKVKGGESDEEAGETKKNSEFTQ